MFHLSIKSKAAKKNFRAIVIAENVAGKGSGEGSIAAASGKL